MLLAQRENCCGCGACANICPRKCIKMNSNEEGFMFPAVDDDKCINCGLCRKVCPCLNKIEESTHVECYIIQNRDEKIRKNSTAGGGYSAFAEYILEQGGAVSGAIYTEQLDVKHIVTSDKKDISSLSGSKYVQSEMNDVYLKIKDELDNGKKVLFCGTPCQVAAVELYMKLQCKKNDDNLITISVACRAVPSPLVFKKYIEFQQDRFNQGIIRVCCRDKYFGYSYSTMGIYPNKNTKVRAYHRSIESDPYLRAFFSGICNRESCSKCKFRGNIGDLQIGDYFRISEMKNDMNDDKGATRLTIYNDKGKNLFNETKEKFKYIEISQEKLKSTIHNSIYSGDKLPDRKQYFEDLHRMSPEQFFTLYYPDTLRIKIMRYGRYITYKIGIYNALKRGLRRLKRGK